jgi:hypothetical protein
MEAKVKCAECRRRITLREAHVDANFRGVLCDRHK